MTKKKNKLQKMKLPVDLKFKKQITSTMHKISSQAVQDTMPQEI